MAKTQEKLYKVTRVRARKPAQVKMCPHCKKNIAARGLQGHIRIVHPEKLGLPKPIPKNSKTEPKKETIIVRGKEYTIEKIAALAEYWYLAANDFSKKLKAKKSEEETWVPGADHFDSVAFRTNRVLAEEKAKGMSDEECMRHTHNWPTKDKKH